jgi:tetratricopeptide (TPR) repeat protein
MRIERVDQTPAEALRPGDDSAEKKPVEKRSRGRDPVVDVSHVGFDGVAASTGQKMQHRLAEAAVAFQNERFTEAERLLSSIERLAPGVAEVHELQGLTQYRLGRWDRALAELQAFTEQTGSVEQHPVMADCCRALGRWVAAEELWTELGAVSPSLALVEEGRIVHAGGLADRGRIAEAIRLLERAPKPPHGPGVHHLRRWYALADLYERSGDLARARRVFGQIIDVDDQFGDVAERLAALG